MIPALAFNDSAAVLSTDVRAFGDAVATTIPKIDEFASLDRNQQFHYKVSVIDLDDVKMIAYAQNGVYVSRGRNEGVDFIIPLRGKNSCGVSRTHYNFDAGSSVLMLVDGESQIRSYGNGVHIRLDRAHLSTVWSSMNGADNRRAMSYETNALHFIHGSVSFQILFLNLFRQIDALRGNSRILQRLGIADTAYRLCAGLLQDASFFVDEFAHKKKSLHDQKVSELCDWLNSRLTDAVSLTKLEQQSGLSARILQYAFKSKFGMGPTLWLRKQRLCAARDILLDRNAIISLTDLSYQFCFSSPSEFARFYKQEFGELPSETARRERKRIRRFTFEVQLPVTCRGG